ncbi:MAG: GNAT family N-acetyltransferase [Alphaproteobacteria bacterium]|nr:GNAT family N-acetyltransferase [Alphaproteobacteria bacterium]
MIEVVPYNPDWPRIFEADAAQMKQALGDNCIAVHHVGSTAVPGLCAKPKIDIILVVKDMVHVVQNLEKIGYEYRGEFNIPLHLGFKKRPPLSNVNLHVYEEGNPEIELNLLFRDYLRTHPEPLEEYAALKWELVKQDASHHIVHGPFKGYTLEKDVFIKKILNQVGFNGLCMRFCTHYDEWEAARGFRQKYFFDKVPVTDPYTWTFDHQDHVHFVFYRGTEIVGYAHIQLWKDQRAAVRIIVIDKNSRAQGLGGHFLTLCERWLKEKGFKTFHTQSSPDAYGFYKKQGYSEMPFNDPDGYESDPQDIEMGKVLYPSPMKKPY